MLRGLWPCFCFLLSENSSHTPPQQSLPKHRQTKGNQPAHHWKERSEPRMPTGEPKDTPRHGFCLAHVHVHRCDLLLYLFIFLFREHSPFSFLVRLPQVLPFLLSLSFSRSLQPSVSASTGTATRGVPCVLSWHTCVRVSGLFRYRGYFGYSMYTVTLPLMWTGSHLFCPSLWL